MGVDQHYFIKFWHHLENQISYYNMSLALYILIQYVLHHVL